MVKSSRRGNYQIWKKFPGDPIPIFGKIFQLCDRRVNGIYIQLAADRRKFSNKSQIHQVLPDLPHLTTFGDPSQFCRSLPDPPNFTNCGKSQQLCQKLPDQENFSIFPTSWKASHFLPGLAAAGKAGKFWKAGSSYQFCQKLVKLEITNFWDRAQKLEKEILLKLLTFYKNPAIILV